MQGGGTVLGAQQITVDAPALHLTLFLGNLGDTSTEELQVRQQMVDNKAVAFHYTCGDCCCCPGVPRHQEHGMLNFLPNVYPNLLPLLTDSMCCCRLRWLSLVLLRGALC
jgi:hypothetical protein